MVLSYEREKKGDRRKYLVAAGGAEALLRQDFCDFLLGKKFCMSSCLVESAGIFEKGTVRMQTSHKANATARREVGGRYPFWQNSEFGSGILGELRGKTKGTMSSDDVEEDRDGKGARIARGRRRSRPGKTQDGR